MKLNNYLTFQGQAEAAFRFYETCLGGKIVALMRFGDDVGDDDGPGCVQMPVKAGDGLMHVRLLVGDQVLMGSDCPPGMPYEGIKGCSVSLQVDSVDEGQRLFDALGEGGMVQVPYAPTFWADGFGMLVDRFGVPWMINCEKPS